MREFHELGQYLGPLVRRNRSAQRGKSVGAFLLVVALIIVLVRFWHV